MTIKISTYVLIGGLALTGIGLYGCNQRYRSSNANYAKVQELNKNHSLY